MRTLIVSDLHLGNGAGYDVFAGGEALPAFLDRFVSPPTRVILNGDSVDFLMNEDPLELEVTRAVGQARAIAREPATKAVFEALGRVLAAGGEVIVRLGNHDIEVALPEVQEVFRGVLGQPPNVAARLTFQTDEAPAVIDVGGARILVTHGEHNDRWNVVDYSKLGKSPKYTYSPGSLLVKRFMNPLKRQHGLRFADLLKPDFQGAVLTALAVAPSAMKLLFQSASVSVLWQLFRKMQMPLPYIEGEQEPGLTDKGDQDLGLAERIKEAGLTEEEREAIEALLGDGPAMFAGEDDGVLSRANMKLARTGLLAYANLQRTLTGTSAAAYFELAPSEAEWTEAKRLAKKFNASGVLIGHTHSARWKEEDGITFANTGTWIWLMQLPAADASSDEWAEFLAEMKNNPGLKPEKAKHVKLRSRFTAALAEPAEGGGATLTLIEWDPASSAIRTLGSSRLAAS